MGDSVITRRYLHAGMITLAISSVSAVYLNFEGVKCLISLSRSNDTVYSQRDLEQASANCFVITNSYVYSPFGVVAGLIMIILWAYKRRKTRGLG